MFINFVSLLVGLGCIFWLGKRFPEFIESIKTRDFLPMIGLGVYVVMSFMSPSMVFTAVVFVGIIEYALRKKDAINKMI
jgi:hypothetical protein